MQTTFSSTKFKDALEVSEEMKRFKEHGLYIRMMPRSSCCTTMLLKLCSVGWGKGCVRLCPHRPTGSCSVEPRLCRLPPPRWASQKPWAVKDNSAYTLFPPNILHVLQQAFHLTSKHRNLSQQQGLAPADLELTLLSRANAIKHQDTLEDTCFPSRLCFTT